MINQKTRRRTNRIRTKRIRRNPLKPKNPSKKIRNNTPHYIRTISKDIRSSFESSSYKPSINYELMTLHSSLERITPTDCNNEKAFQLKEPIKIKMGDHGRCLNYTSMKAKQLLLKNLSANKHIDPSKVIPPVQIDANCWFNAFFVMFFVSDKGRKFFQFFRQLMIEGKQINGNPIKPLLLRNAFSLLNFAIDSSLTGSKFAYTLNTNSIIKQIYEAIPDKSPYIVKIDEASNPLRYYDAIIRYLNNDALKIQLIVGENDDWENLIINEVIPHMIVVEIYDDASKTMKNKPTKISKTYSNGETVEYTLDSCVIRDIDQNHFCSMITCERKEMAYDGMSFHRLTPMKWKQMLTKEKEWQFEGSNDIDDKPIRWSFKNGYQMLVYYRSN